MHELKAVVEASSIGRGRTIEDFPWIDRSPAGDGSEDFPGIDRSPAGEGFEDFLRQEASVPLAIPLRLPLLEIAEADVEGELLWQERGLCAQTDPEAFFPEKGGSTREAKRVCVSCEVRSQCLEYALEHDERFGIWGGLSERERRRLKKQAG